MHPSSHVALLEKATGSRIAHLLYFFPQLSSVRKAKLELLEAARPRRPGRGELGPPLRMARPQLAPWVHTGFLLCLLGLGGAIEIPMDREFFYSPDLGQKDWREGDGRGELRPTFQEGEGKGNSEFWMQNRVSQRMAAGRLVFGNMRL